MRRERQRIPDSSESTKTNLYVTLIKISGRAACPWTHVISTVIELRKATTKIAKTAAAKIKATFCFILATLSFSHSPFRLSSPHYFPLLLLCALLIGVRDDSFFPSHSFRCALFVIAKSPSMDGFLTLQYFTKWEKREEIINRNTIM